MNGFCCWCHVFNDSSIVSGFSIRSAYDLVAYGRPRLFSWQICVRTPALGYRSLIIFCFSAFFEFTKTGGEWEHLRSLFLSLSPYLRQSAPVRTHFASVFRTRILRTSTLAITGQERFLGVVVFSPFLGPKNIIKILFFFFPSLLSGSELSFWRGLCITCI